MSKYLSFVIVFVLSSPLFAQKSLELKQFGFSMNEPENWFKNQNDEVWKNINRFDLTEQEREAMFKSLNSASNFIAYYKYDPLQTRGIIPTVNVTVRNTKVTTQDKFGLYLVKVNEHMKGVVQNLVASTPEIIKIGNLTAWLIQSSYDWKDPTGKEVRLNNKTVYLYRDTYYISLALVEEIGKENNNAVFDEILSSIEFTSVKHTN